MCPISCAHLLFLKGSYDLSGKSIPARLVDFRAKLVDFRARPMRILGETSRILCETIRFSGRN